MNHIAKTILLLLLPLSIDGFTSPLSSLQNSRTNVLYSEVVEKEATTIESSSSTIETDPKEAVKIFGRLAEKYISEWVDVSISVFNQIFLCISCALILQIDLLLINSNISILPPSSPTLHKRQCWMHRLVCAVTLHVQVRRRNILCRTSCNIFFLHISSLPF